MQHEVAQQAELGGGQLHVLAITADALAALVQVQAGRFQPGLVGQAMGAAEQRLDAQSELFGMEGLGQVIVGAGLEAIDALGPGAARGEDQHRRRQAAGAPLLEHLEPRLAGQAEVENDQVVGFAGPLVQCVTAIGQPIHGVALAAEAGGQLISQRYMVLYQQQPHQSSSSSFRIRPSRASSSSSRTVPSAVISSTS
ncbi:hypothetical protein D3C84_689510 [compost metagenome]